MAATPHAVTHTASVSNARHWAGRIASTLAILCFVMRGGAFPLTGYLGGAVATRVRVVSPLFSIVFPLILGALLWGGLYLGDARLHGMTKEE